MREEQTSHVIEKPDRTEVITGGVRTLFQGQNRSAAGQIAMLHQIIRQLQLEQSRQINDFLGMARWPGHRPPDERLAGDPDVA